MYGLKNGQAIHQNTEDNNIKYNNKINNKEKKKYSFGYENQREYTTEELNKLIKNHEFFD